MRETMRPMIGLPSRIIAAKLTGVGAGAAGRRRVVAQDGVAGDGTLGFGSPTPVHPNPFGWTPYGVGNRVRSFGHGSNGVSDIGPILDPSSA